MYLCTLCNLHYEHITAVKTHVVILTTSCADDHSDLFLWDQTVTLETRPAAALWMFLLCSASYSNDIKHKAAAEELLKETT